MLSGHLKALDRAQELAVAKGALKVTKLAVSGAFQGDSLVYSVFDGPNTVNGAIAIDVVAPQPAATPSRTPWLWAALLAALALMGGMAWSLLRKPN